MTKTNEAKDTSPTEEFLATLVRGRWYSLVASRKVFRTNEPQPVTAAEKSHLEQHARDTITVFDPLLGTSQRLESKFRFEPVP